MLELPRETLWQLGVLAYQEKRLWLDLMRENPDLSGIASFLTDLAGRSLHEPLEEILSELIGADPHLIPDNEDEEISDLAAVLRFQSPFKRYYFSSDCYQNNSLQYLTFLSSLRIFVQRLRDYRPNEALQIEDMLSFVDTHLRNQIPVLDTSELATGADSIQLLTAHKAKGLEFDTVFITSCADEVWAGRGRSALIRFPLNLPLAPSSDATDDKIRLFYVALTRAKRHLYLSTYASNEKGQPVTSLQFLPPDIWLNLPDTDPVSTLEKTVKSWTHRPIEQEERALLARQLERYVLNVTHLNNFLDVVHAGPQAFLEQNLLRFPQPKSVSGAFGSAIHASLHQMSAYVQEHRELPEESEVLRMFESQLASQRLNPEQFKFQLQRGRMALSKFYAARSSEFLQVGESERDFRSQGVMLGRIPITGKIDRITKQDRELTVHDFKTGKAASSWSGRNLDEKVKLWNYRRQLVFYKLLVENARDYAGQQVVMGRLEFVEPDKATGKLLQLELIIAPEETERLTALVAAVHRKIINLDFPDTTRYAQDLSGIQSFEDDLLSERI